MHESPFFILLHPQGKSFACGLIIMILIIIIMLCEEPFFSDSSTDKSALHSIWLCYGNIYVYNLYILC